MDYTLKGSLGSEVRVTLNDTFPPAAAALAILAAPPCSVRSRDQGATILLPADLWVPSFINCISLLIVFLIWLKHPL